MSAVTLVRVTDLGRIFGARRVLHGVTLQVSAGEAVALLGANGAGKTTLLRVLATLLRPSRGTVSVAGHDVAKAPEAVRREIGVLAHGAWIYEDLTALENVRFWATLAGRPATADELREALAQVELDRVADARARTFSEGMKRRLALARLALLRPSVLLLDEPFAGLDQRAKKWLEAHLESVKARGGALLLATHSFGRELAVADRIAILAGGRVALDTPRASLDADDIQRLYALHAEEES